MQLARTLGHATATIRHPSMKGVRLVLCETLDADGQATGSVVLAADWTGSGLGSTVVLTSDGSAAAAHVGTTETPLRMVVLGQIDPAAAQETSPREPTAA